MAFSETRRVSLPRGFTTWLHYSLLQSAAKIGRGHGLQRFAWRLGQVFPNAEPALVSIGKHGKMEVPLWDSYWVHVLLGRDHEPEVGMVLDAALDERTAFLDCGSNIGYWAISAIGRAKVVVAVEAAPPTFLRLAENRNLNENRFEILNAVLWSSDAENIQIVTHPRRHAGNSAITRSNRIGEKGYATYAVPSITLTQLYLEYIREGPAIVKLDVEGAEAPALSTSWDLIRSAPLMVLYEDHGSDVSCHVTALVLNAGLEVWSLEGGIIRWIEDIDTVRDIKTDRRRGYNFAATPPGTHFSKIIRSLVRRSTARNKTM